METTLFTAILIIINVIVTFIGGALGPSPISNDSQSSNEDSVIIAEYEEGDELINEEEIVETLEYDNSTEMISAQISRVSGDFANDFFEPSYTYATYTTFNKGSSDYSLLDLTSQKQVLLNNKINEEKTPKLLTRVELPLIGNDYYWGKYINATAGANEINKMGVLKPGDRINLIQDGYITLRLSAGYVKPGSYYGYGSGLCWSVSALGQLMDEANKDFRAQTGMDLFVFRAGDRSPHSKWYRTYQNSNNGFGYAVIKTRSLTMDYSFTVNPALKEKYPNLNVQIILSEQSDHPEAIAGQSINGEVLLSGY